MKSKGEVVHRSTCRYLLTGEVNDEKELRRKFNVMIEEKLAPKAVSKDFEEIGLEENPTFDKYEDDIVEVTPDEPLEEVEPTPYLSSNVYLNASILLPQGYIIARGEVIRRKREVNVHPIGR